MQVSDILNFPDRLWFLYFKAPFDEKCDGVYRDFQVINTIEGYDMISGTRVSDKDMVEKSPKYIYFFIGSLESVQLVSRSFSIIEENYHIA